MPVVPAALGVRLYPCHSFFKDTCRIDYTPADRMLVTTAILRGLRPRYEAHHGVRIQDAAILAAATLSHRYIADRFLPDKAIDLVDEAASRLRIENDSMPAALDELRRRIMQLEIEREAVRLEVGGDGKVRGKSEAEGARRELDRIERELAELQEKNRGASGDMRLASPTT